jgi:hypothetical protein
VLLLLLLGSHHGAHANAVLTLLQDRLLSCSTLPNSMQLGQLALLAAKWCSICTHA